MSLRPRLAAEPTPFDDLADAVLRVAIGKKLPRIRQHRFFGFLVVLRASVRVAAVKRQQVQVLLRAP